MMDGYLGAGLALAFGLLGLSAGAWHVQRVKRLLRSGIRVPAVVVAVADPTDAAIPTVEFVDADGEIQRVELTFGEGSATVGTTIPVIYLPGQPEKACPVSSYGLWFVPVGCLVVGVVGLWAAAQWKFTASGWSHRRWRSRAGDGSYALQGAFRSRPTFRAPGNGCPISDYRKPRLLQLLDVAVDLEADFSSLVVTGQNREGRPASTIQLGVSGNRFIARHAPLNERPSDLQSLMERVAAKGYLVVGGLNQDSSGRRRGSASQNSIGRDRGKCGNGDTEARPEVAGAMHAIFLGAIKGVRRGGQ